MDTRSPNLARKSDKLYYLRDEGGRECLIEVDLGTLLAEGTSGTDGEEADRERVVAILPPDHRGEGGFALDAEERVA